MIFSLIEVLAVILITASATFILTYQYITGIECTCDFVKDFVINIST